MAKSRFEGKVVWVTGASSGIGEALAQELSREGARLVISARRAELLEALKARCARPDDVAILPMDVAKTELAKSHVEQALAAFGKVDVMVHNAGIGQRSLISETSLEEDRRIMEVNYFGVIALTKALLPEMKARGGGHFVVVSSVTGYVGTPFRSGYAASKHALHGFFESLRAEGHREGIEVTMVCPGFVDTEIAIKAIDRAGGGDAVKDETRAKANKHGITAEQCARVMVDGMAKRSREIYVGGKEIAGIYARRYAPGLLARVLRRVETV
ncbi:MAG: SDR family oxidoreductase [Sandaracinus sp.]